MLSDLELYPHQKTALSKMRPGCILRGGVGSGKSLTALMFFFSNVMGGVFESDRSVTPFTHPTINKLLIITPAKKREELEWEKEAANFGFTRDPSVSYGGIELIVDSWQNVVKYKELKGAFVIFDEQRLVGSGAWVKAFYAIAKNNPWILLSATPGDDWLDYIPVMVANGFYRNKTEFIDRHVVYMRYSKFPKVDYYVNEARLLKIRDRIEVEMPFVRHTTRHIRTLGTSFDEALYQRTLKDRWNIWTDEPIKNSAELMQCLRRVVNDTPERLSRVGDVWEKHGRVIVFYSFTYELEALREYCSSREITYSEWNGQKHQPIPDTNSWLYLVQYTAGSDAWNCILTDAIVFFSLQYSYRTFEQCQGRIDRLNTLYTDLYYYVIRTSSKIDQAIWQALVKKRNFNEKTFISELQLDDLEGLLSP